MDITQGTAFFAVYFSLWLSTYNPLTCCYSLLFSYSRCSIEQDLKDLSHSFKFPHRRKEYSSSQHSQIPSLSVPAGFFTCWILTWGLVLALLSIQNGLLSKLLLLYFEKEKLWSLGAFSILRKEERRKKAKEGRIVPIKMLRVGRWCCYL